MAIYRETPKCSFCGEPKAEAQYKDESSLPVNQQCIGDTFIGWKDLNHTCEGLEKAYKEWKENRKDFNLDHIWKKKS